MGYGPWGHEESDKTERHSTARRPTSHVLRGMQAKVAMTYHYTPIEPRKSGTLTIPDADEDVSNRNSDTLLLGMQNCYGNCVTQFESFFQK